MSTGATRRVAELLSVPEGFVIDLCEAGIVVIEGDDVHDEAVIERVRVSWTLHHDLGVNLPGIEVALHLLGIIRRDRQALWGG